MPNAGSKPLLAFGNRHSAFGPLFCNGLIAPVLAFGLAASAAWTVVPQPRAQRLRPNVLLIQADDLGYGDLSAYGQTRFATPNLDQLAREGIRFTQYYAGSTVCAPSRNALMTGQHTGHTFIRGNSKRGLRPQDVTIATVLRGAGYRTAFVGKWGLGDATTSGE